jgi:hypothetical protein
MAVVAGVVFFAIRALLALINETMSNAEGFSFDYAAAGGVSATPLPATWTMMLIGLAGFGFVAYRRKSKPALMIA